MNRINEYDIEPGTYRHYKGNYYVVVGLITHMDNPATRKMDALPDPLVCYRDLTPIPGHDVKGRAGFPYKRYARPLSEFFQKVDKGNGELVTRFTPE